MDSGLQQTPPDDFALYREAFVQYLKDAQRTSVTIKNYLCDLNGFAQWWRSVRGHFCLYDIQAQHVESYQIFLTTEKGLKPASVNRKLASLQTFLKWANQADLVPQDHRISLPPKLQVPTRTIGWLSQAQQQSLLQCVEQSQHQRDLVVVKLLLLVGLRVEELCSLTWANLTVEAGIAFLAVPYREHKPLPRLQLPHDVAQALFQLRQQAFRGEQEPIIEGLQGRMSPRGVQLLLKKYSERIGVPKLSPRLLRHTYALNLVSSGVSPDVLAALLGHTSLDSTITYYSPALRQELVHKGLAALNRQGTKS